MMDTIELTPSGGKKCCLVMVMWSKWVEAFPCSSQSANDVLKAQLAEILPRWAVPTRVSFDNGSHFVNEASSKIGSLVGIDMQQHSVYHPSSLGQESGKLVP